MNYELKDNFLRVGAGILIIFISVTALFAAFNILDVENPIFNPPPEEHAAMYSIPIVPIGSTPAEPVNEVIGFVIHYTGDVIVERQPVTIEGIGSPLDNEALSNILLISLTFEGSSAYYPDMKPGTQSQYPPPGVIFVSRESDSGKVLRPEVNNVQIFWQTSGNFAPVLTITYEDHNGSHVPGDAYSQKYSEFTIPVSSADVLVQARYTRMDIALTIALFVFAVSESLVLVAKIMNRRKKRR